MTFLHSCHFETLFWRFQQTLAWPKFSALDTLWQKMTDDGGQSFYFQQGGSLASFWSVWLPSRMLRLPKKPFNPAWGSRKTTVVWVIRNIVLIRSNVLKRKPRFSCFCTIFAFDNDVQADVWLQLPVIFKNLKTIVDINTESISLCD